MFILSVNMHIQPQYSEKFLKNIDFMHFHFSINVLLFSKSNFMHNEKLYTKGKTVLQRLYSGILDFTSIYA